MGEKVQRLQNSLSQLPTRVQRRKNTVNYRSSGSIARRAETENNLSSHDDSGFLKVTNVQDRPDSHRNIVPDQFLVRKSEP